MKNEPSNQRNEPTYRSGTAARLAGIPVDTLRMWERRYQVVGPQVSARGHRRYAAEDVGRLALIKGLVDLGHPIGTIAHLSATKLRELRARLATLPRATQARAWKSSIVRVAIVGEALAARAAAAASRFPRLQIVATCTDRELAAGALRDLAVDLLAIELPALREDAVEFVDALAAALGARRAVVSYRFGTEAAVRELRRRGHAVARAPVDLAQIESSAQPCPAPPRRQRRASPRHRRHALTSGRWRNWRRSRPRCAANARATWSICCSACAPSSATAPSAKTAAPPMPNCTANLAASRGARARSSRRPSCVLRRRKGFRCRPRMLEGRSVRLRLPRVSFGGCRAPMPRLRVRHPLEPDADAKRHHRSRRSALPPNGWHVRPRAAAAGPAATSRQADLFETVFKERAQ